jgi:putative flippase GtrA
MTADRYTRHNSRPMIRKILDKLPQGLPAFALIGGIGFLVDALVLALLVHGHGWGKYSARFVSFAIAVTVTWLLNRNFTFADNRTSNRRSEYTRYITVQITGMGINLLIYSLCIETSAVMDRWPVIALAVGSAVALIFNYVGARIFVFTGETQGSN